MAFDEPEGEDPREESYRNATVGLDEQAAADIRRLMGLAPLPQQTASDKSGRAAVEKLLRLQTALEKAEKRCGDLDQQISELVSRLETLTGEADSQHEAAARLRSQVQAARCSVRSPEETDGRGGDDDDDHDGPPAPDSRQPAEAVAVAPAAGSYMRILDDAIAADSAGAAGGTAAAASSADPTTPRGVARRVITKHKNKRGPYKPSDLDGSGWEPDGDVEDALL